MTWVIDSTVLLNVGKADALWIIEQGLVDPKRVIERLESR